MDSSHSQRFTGICKRLGLVESRSVQLWQLIRKSYAEPHRYYHNLSHIGKMLLLLDESGQHCDELELAIWFHDIVYEPMSVCNEEKSAHVFGEQLGALLGKQVAETVERLIVATDPGRARSGMADEDLLIDIDLSILGGSRSAYQDYAVAIRKEYAEIAEHDFRVGRRAVLESFLSKPIYTTAFFGRLEGAARDNMRWELGGLEQGR